MPLPIIIIGGGPVGLTASIALSQQQIPHLLFERYPGTSIHPKAVGLNARTMEIFRALGLEADILSQAAPPHTHSKTAWYTSLGPEGREIFTRDAWGGGVYAEEYRSFSACRLTVLPQIRLEPILLNRAREMNPGGIFYSAEVDVVRELGDHVAVTVLHSLPDGSREVMTYEASYVIAADGGRTVGPQLGIKMSGGEGGGVNILDMVSAHIKAPLSLIHPNPDVLITWFIDPAKGGSINTGYLYHLGPYNGTLNLDEEEWMFACATNPADPKIFEEEDMLRRLNVTLQLPRDIKERIQLQSTSHWLVNAVVADRFRSEPEKGRVFLVGDAAHRIPPWGALGLNTGIQDVHNLVWKLGFVTRDFEELGRYRMNGFLDTYETERRPIALRVAQTSLSNLQNHALAMDRALGIYPTQSAEDNIASLNAYFDETHPNHGGLRTAVTEAQKVLDSEFHAPGTEMGWFYPMPWFTHEHGGQIKDGQFDAYTYHVCIEEGHHMPHFWVMKDEVRLSVRDLVRHDQFTLFTKVRNWRRFKDCHEVVVEILDGKKGLWADELGVWENLPDIRTTSALLVRPDGIIAWHIPDQLDSDEYLEKILIRKILQYD
ncbi:FAD binding domain-containing protein [Aspergillus venezuelensis]